MLQKNIKIIAIASVILNLVLGIVIARNLGQISAFEDVKRIYLAAACENIDTFRHTLENFDVNALFDQKSIGAKITPEQKNKWVEKHISSCFPFAPGSAEAAKRLAIIAMVEQHGFEKEGNNYFSTPEVTNGTARVSVVLDEIACELELTTDGAKAPYGWLIKTQKCL